MGKIILPKIFKRKVAEQQLNVIFAELLQETGVKEECGPDFVDGLQQELTAKALNWAEKANQKRSPNQKTNIL